MAAKTRLELQTMVVRYAHINSNDTTVMAGILEDMNIAIGIVATKRDWPQLIKTGTISLTAADGDTSYSLNSDVDQVNQLIITSPTSYSHYLPEVSKETMRKIIPNKSLPGLSPPSRWYFSEPAISATNVETKKITFDYRPDQAYTITYSYKRFPPTMDADGAYPFFDSTYHQMLAYYAIWKYAERATDIAVNPNYWQAQWQGELEQMLMDEQSQEKYPLQIPGPDEAY